MSLQLHVESKKNVLNHLPKGTWEIGCQLQKNYNSKFLSSSWNQVIWRWFPRWDVEEYLDMFIEYLELQIEDMNSYFTQPYRKSTQNGWVHKETEVH